MAVTDEAIEKIKEMIVSGSLRPGDRLPKESELAAVLGLSLSMAGQMGELEALARWARAEAPGTKLVAGGFAFAAADLPVPAGVAVVAPTLGTRQTLDALVQAGLPLPKA